MKTTTWSLGLSFPFGGHWLEVVIMGVSGYLLQQKIMQNVIPYESDLRFPRRKRLCLSR